MAPPAAPPAGVPGPGAPERGGSAQPGRGERGSRAAPSLRPRSRAVPAGRRFWRHQRGRFFPPQPAGSDQDGTRGGRMTAGRAQRRERRGGVRPQPHVPSSWASLRRGGGREGGSGARPALPTPLISIRCLFIIKFYIEPDAAQPVPAGSPPAHWPAGITWGEAEQIRMDEYFNSGFDNVFILFTISLKTLSFQQVQSPLHLHFLVFTRREKGGFKKTATAGAAAPALETKIKTFILF